MPHVRASALTPSPAALPQQSARSEFPEHSLRPVRGHELGALLELRHAASDTRATRGTPSSRLADGGFGLRRQRALYARDIQRPGDANEPPSSRRAHPAQPDAPRAHRLAPVQREITVLGRSTWDASRPKVKVGGFIVTGTPEEVQEVVDALDYIEQVPEVRELIRRVEYGKRVLEILVDHRGPTEYGLPPMIRWNPRQGVRYDGGILSPALQLGHEFSHASRRTPEPTDEAEMAEEMRAVEFENLIARYHGEPIRTTYDGEPCVVNGPLDMFLPQPAKNTLTSGETPAREPIATEPRYVTLGFSGSALESVEQTRQQILGGLEQVSAAKTGLQQAQAQLDETEARLASVPDGSWHDGLSTLHQLVAATEQTANAAYAMLEPALRGSSYKAEAAQQGEALLLEAGEIRQRCTQLTAALAMSSHIPPSQIAPHLPAIRDYLQQQVALLELTTSYYTQYLPRL